MNPLAGDVSERCIDHALALQTRCTCEAGAFYFHGKVAFAAAIVAGMAVVLFAVVDHGEVVGGEGGSEQPFDFLGEWSCHVFHSSGIFPIWKPVRHDRFHGRVSGTARGCDRPGCDQQGEFRAPGGKPGGFDGPGDYRWYCLDHVREFNSGYDWFAGMSADEILAAQHPTAGWDNESRAFRPTAGVDQAPRWADFKDPLDAISGRARAFRPQARADGRAVTPDERRALDVLKLSLDADRTELRRRYSQLVRRYHPDRNGGDRSMEAKLQATVEAYNLLRASALFA